MNDNMRKLIAKVERLDRKATPGPWHRRDAETENGYVTSAVSLDTADEDGLTPCDLPIVGRTITAGIAGNDAALIAHYRTAAPLLAAEVRRLRAEVLSWTRTAAMHEHMYLEIAAENEDLRLTLAAEQGRQEGAPIESNEAADEYDYTRCICLDSVSRWCPTCGEEYAERRAADKALKSDAPDGIEVVQVADLQSARDGRAQVLREGASLTIRCVIHDQPLQATHCGGGGGEGMMDLAIPVYRCGVCGYAAHSIDWIQDHIKRWWLPNGAESTRMDIDAERHDGEPWSTQYLRVGDSVMWSVGRGGYNGLRGRVVAIQPDLTWFTVRWADGRSLPYETNDTLWALFPRRQEGVRS